MQPFYKRLVIDTFEELVLHYKVCVFSFSELLTWIKGKFDCIWKAWKVNEVDRGQSLSIPNVLHQATLLSQVKKKSKSNMFWKLNSEFITDATCASQLTFELWLGHFSSFWKAYEVYFPTDSTPPSYHLEVGCNHHFTPGTFSVYRCYDTCFWLVGQQQLVTASRTSYGVRLRHSSSSWKDNEVYFPMDPTSPPYHLIVGHNCRFTPETFSIHRCCDIYFWPMEHVSCWLHIGHVLGF